MIPHEYINDGNGTIWLDDIICSGSEHKLINCTYSIDTAHCFHRYDVGVKCYLSCPAEEDEGSAENRGRLEINYRGEWGTICSSRFGHVEAAACRQLGYCSGEAIPSNLVDDGNETIWLDDINCSGSEHKLINCTYSIDTSHCSHWYDVGIDCFNCATEDEGDLRILSTSQTNIGRLEIYNEGEWGTVCDNQFENVDAEVACRQLGYCSGMMIPSNRVDDGQGSIWFNDIDCSGSEKNYSIVHTLSKHHSVITMKMLACIVFSAVQQKKMKVFLRLITGSASNKGRLEINYRGEWGTICYFGHVEAAVACRQLGYWCLLRLITGFASNKGRLEINYRGEWGTICSSRFGHVEAAVACRQLGYCSGQMLPSQYVEYGNGTIWLNSITCSGSEHTLINCTYSMDTSDCYHLDDVGVHCYLSCLAEEDEGLLRLITGSSSNKGRLEINYRGEWGTICYSRFGHVEAAVACRQLGYCSGQMIPSQYVEDGNGPIWLNSITCSGSEHKLINCTYSIDTSNCTHWSDVGVKCYLSCPAEEDEEITDICHKEDLPCTRRNIRVVLPSGVVCKIREQFQAEQLTNFK
ncbi:unnamed protein product [Mytilus edulis]|uniref:SRCR domain-containing protein n=1 Tax=Mytilus edulis TaxID=6550 RepID=A0A8S3TCU6_MYTED|nr:unnamed protein product [Mytilus edulis]